MRRLSPNDEQPTRHATWTIVTEPLCLDGQAVLEQPTRHARLTVFTEPFPARSVPEEPVPPGRPA